MNAYNENSAPGRFVNSKPAGPAIEHLVRERERDMMEKQTTRQGSASPPPALASIDIALVGAREMAGGHIDRLHLVANYLGGSQPQEVGGTGAKALESPIGGMLGDVWRNAVLLGDTFNEMDAAIRRLEKLVGV